MCTRNQRWLDNAPAQGVFCSLLSPDTVWVCLQDMCRENHHWSSLWEHYLYLYDYRVLEVHYLDHRLTPLKVCAFLPMVGLWLLLSKIFSNEIWKHLLLARPRENILLRAGVGEVKGFSMSMASIQSDFWPI